MASENGGDHFRHQRVSLRIHVPWTVQRLRVCRSGESREAVDCNEPVAPSAFQDPRCRPALGRGKDIVLPRASVVEGNDNHLDIHRALKSRQSLGQPARYGVARALGMDPNVITEPMLQIWVQSTEYPLLQAAQAPPGRSVSRRWHRHSPEWELSGLRGGPWLVAPPEGAKPPAPDIVGNEADDHDRNLVGDSQTLAAKHDLIKTVTAHSAVQHAPAEEALELSRPRLLVGDVLAKGKRVAQRQNRWMGWRTGKDPGAAQAVAIDGQAGLAMPGPRHVA